MRTLISAADATEMIRLYTAGLTCKEVGAALGRCKSSVENVLARAGIARREAKPRTPLAGERNGNWKGGRYLDTQGYVHVWTPDGYKREHRLVTDAKPGEIVHHKDHDLENNARENLEVLASHTEHRAEHVAEQREKFGVAIFPDPLPGELNPRSKLTEEDVREIRALRGKVSQRELGARFGVTKTAIRYAQLGRNWKCVREFPR
jgi:hypothetical protein